MDNLLICSDLPDSGGMAEAAVRRVSSRLRGSARNTHNRHPRSAHVRRSHPYDLVIDDGRLVSMHLRVNAEESISEIDCPPLEAFQGERVEITLTRAGSGKPNVGQRSSASIRLPLEEQEQRLSSSRDFLWTRTEITNDEGIVALYSPPGTMEITTKIENQLIRRKIDVIEDVTNELRIEVKSPNARLPR